MNKLERILHKFGFGWFLANGKIAWNKDAEADIIDILDDYKSMQTQIDELTTANENLSKAIWQKDRDAQTLFTQFNGLKDLFQKQAELLEMYSVDNEVPNNAKLIKQISDINAEACEREAMFSVQLDEKDAENKKLHTALRQIVVLVFSKWRELSVDSKNEAQSKSDPDLSQLSVPFDLVLRDFEKLYKESYQIYKGK